MEMKNMINDFYTYYNTLLKAPRGKNSSVHGSAQERFNEAVKQAKLYEQAKLYNKGDIDIDNIINCVNDCLKNIGMHECKPPIRIDIKENNNIKYLKNIRIQENETPIEINSIDIDYSKIQRDYNLADKRDIIWMKFTKDGCLGVVATSNDINFNKPESKKDYKKIRNKRWEYNTSGILVHNLCKSWDKTFVLIFPLIDIPKGYRRGDIERVVGNYLIDKGVPIIDFYSHVY
jgi:hypothetical protein